MGRPSLSFYTNNPTPYQIDLFNSLRNYTDLQVCYFTKREGDRQWNLNLDNSGYKIIMLENSRLVKWLNKRIVSFHFSFRIIPVLIADRSETVVVNGTYWAPNVLLAMLISRLRGKKVVFWGEALLPVRNKMTFYIKRFFFLPAKWLTNSLMAIGEVAVASYRLYGYKKEIINVPYSIDNSKFLVNNLLVSKLDTLKNKYKPSDEIVFLTSGSLIARKGIDVIIKAFKRLDKSLKSRLLILGDGPLKNELLALADGNSNIHFLGFQEKEDIPYFFAISDIFVFASQYDGWALVINEAIASGLPVISSNKVGAAADNLKNDINSIILSPDDITGYFDAMERMIRDPDFRTRLAENILLLNDKTTSDYNAKLIYGICRIN